MLWPNGNGTPSLSQSEYQLTPPDDAGGWGALSRDSGADTS
jgi:hypothetical protein